jgi:SpoVK/Ycf46/Vps4 family AAA+-type ATPase
MNTPETIDFDNYNFSVLENSVQNPDFNSWALYYNAVIVELKENVSLLTQIHQTSQWDLLDKISDLKKEKQSLELILDQKKEVIESFEKKRKAEQDNSNSTSKFQIIKYKKTRKSLGELEINSIFSSLRTIKDIIKLNTRWDEIKHDSKLQRLHNIIPALSNLDQMVGLDQVKEEIFKVIIYWIQNPHTDEYLHTIIEGPPGVGKTEFAKIYSDIFVRMGILKTDKFIEIKKNDLVAKYLGQTSHRTKELLESGMGGVIFLDEAYSLGNAEGRDSFAKEAIDMINQYLSERKKDFMFIVAGYSDDLEKCFFAFNKGLKRRFAHSFTIASYTPEELGKIFLTKIEARGYTLDKSIDINKFFKNHKARFGSYGGDVEKFVNYIKYDQSLRCFKSNIVSKNIIPEDMQTSVTKLSQPDIYQPPPGMYL